MNFSRRGILGGLFAAPIAAPAVVNQIAKEKAERYVSSMPWNPATVPFSDHAMDAMRLGSPKTASAWGRQAELRDQALKAYVLTTGKLPDWMLEEIDRDITRTSFHHNVEALKSVSGTAKVAIMNRKLKERRVEAEIDRIAFSRDRYRAFRERVRGFWLSLGVQPDGALDAEEERMNG